MAFQEVYKYNDFLCIGNPPATNVNPSVAANAAFLTESRLLLRRLCIVCRASDTSSNAAWMGCLLLLKWAIVDLFEKAICPPRMVLRAG